MAGSMQTPVKLRRAEELDHDTVWRIIEPTIRAGETWALPREWSRDEALRYWFAPTHEVWLAERCDVVQLSSAASGASSSTHSNSHSNSHSSAPLGTYFLRPAQFGPGSHIANAGYMVRTDAWGGGVASAMCDHSLERARALGFTAMQFNFVVSTNTRAIALWERKGFRIIGRSPGAYLHATLGAVDAVMMHRAL